MATPSTTDATTTATTVATSITSAKRLRALRKKLNRITQMEDSLSQGKTLNFEQLDVLRSKPAVVAVIDELEKLRAPLSSALDDELSLAPPPPPPPQPQQQSPQNNDNANGDNETTTNDVVKELVKLMYFGSLFDVKPQSEFTSLMLTRTLERGCCLTYDYVTDDANDDLLGERDLDSISTLQGLMIARPAHSTLSHQNALERCFEYALLWLQNSNQPIDPQSDVTYATLREKLNKIMSSDYFTALPEMKGPGEELQQPQLLQTSDRSKYRCMSPWQKLKCLFKWRDQPSSIRKRRKMLPTTKNMKQVSNSPVVLRSFIRANLNQKIRLKSFPYQQTKSSTKMPRESTTTEM
ncbi:hypothetical protein RND81_11G029300 [Saponaria officinalis]|uniref:Uncharacterized protein n=1 Tax=Saponaria officinalis TaxID=3572 RepID=A0AAW1HIW9_SAPOF